MDLNDAMHMARTTGKAVRDDNTMREGWTIRFVKEEDLLYFFDPAGEKAHKVRFTDAHRVSFQWRAIPNDEK